MNILSTNLSTVLLTYLYNHKKIYIMTVKIILASTSKGRQMVLKNAGIAIDKTINAHIDEDIFKQKISCPDTLALQLSCKKALAVSQKYPDTLVIGGDQTLSLHNTLYDKSTDIYELREKLLVFSGKTHILHSGIAVAQGEKIVFSGVWHAYMHMRILSAEFIDGYIHTVGKKVLSSVGGYHFEKEGIQLFESVEGDIFTIVGLPIFPLCRFLREKQCLIS